MCVIWFATAVALSPYRLSDTLERTTCVATLYPRRQSFITANNCSFSRPSRSRSSFFCIRPDVDHREATQPVKWLYWSPASPFGGTAIISLRNISRRYRAVRGFPRRAITCRSFGYTNRNRVEKDSNIGGFIRSSSAGAARSSGSMSVWSCIWLAQLFQCPSRNRDR